ncbi:MAG: amidophosphoribosyltransferase [Rhodospirillales bacterium]|nr:amidophosphoribosyltransferase [Rhodospirillales bacterium]
MCGIVGLYLKNKKLEKHLGKHLTAMLVGMSDRGPDSAGMAVYRNPAPKGSVKLSLFHPDPTFAWKKLASQVRKAFGGKAKGEVRGSHYVLVAKGSPERLRKWIPEHFPTVRIMGIGDIIEIYKEKGRPEQVAQRFRLHELTGTHAIGHTRMATESAVTTEHSHPFSTGQDLCLVHNGSLSNYNRLRQWLQRHGIQFQTDNDTEVAAGYFAFRLQQGDSLKEALKAGLVDLDGFFTFAVGTRDGFAVVRDGIACKPAVLAENDDWVAMASEYRSIAHLPGAEKAKIWEPAPATIYTWGNA